ncbi:hypothetical protein [Lactococcus garvieae]|uniref:hypothetical protein n=1 Tax=Lactococcus garvieae TaxID=1363 RepID=UPI00254AE8D3|nr:hypothetical protein [Lactococcus garvieae]
MYKISPKTLKIIIGIIITMIIVAIIGGGYWLYSKYSQPQVSPEQHITTNKKQEKKPAKPKGLVLSQESIHSFLEAYYNRKDFGSNQEEYKQYVTPTVFNQLVETDKAQEKLQKGFISNRKLSNSQIFINESQAEAYCTSYYTFDQKYDNSEEQEEDVTTLSVQETLHLIFSEENGKYFVSKIEGVQISPVGLGDTTGSGNEDNEQKS